MYAPEWQAVEEVAGRVAVADAQVGLDRCQVALRVRAHALPAAVAVEAAVVGREMAKAPVADIEARAQSREERVALRLARVVGERIAVEDVLWRRRHRRSVARAVAAVACEVQLVVQHRGGDAAVPFFGADGAACRSLQGRLRDAERQALLAAVVGDGGFGNGGGQVDAGVVGEVRQAGKHRHVQAPRVEHAACEAGRGVELALHRGEADVGLAGAALVERDIDEIRPWQHAIARGEQGQVRMRLVSADAEKFRIEVGTARRRPWRGLLCEGGHAQHAECTQHRGVEC
ncbi:hypothetical protein D3C87_1130120 [compost metagenome]